MGQISNPTPRDIILTSIDRLVARNANGGLSAGASHVILLGENAGRNDSLSNVIALGQNALGGAGAGASDTPDMDGTIAIGVGSLANYTTGGNAAVQRPTTAIGLNTGTLMVMGSANVMVGDGILRLVVGVAAQNPQQSTIVGSGAAENFICDGSTAFDENTVVGALAFRQTIDGTNTQRCSAQFNVVIGKAACNNIVSGTIGTQVLQQNVFIGHNCAQGSLDNAIGNIVIGASAGSTLTQGDDNIIIGRNAKSPSTLADTIAIGRDVGAISNGLPDKSILIGAGANNPRPGNTRVIMLGYSCNRTNQNYTDVFLVETDDSTAAKHTILYAEMLNANLVIGNSVQGTDRDTPGTNTLKLINGTFTGNPAGGVMLRAAAAQTLTCRDSAGFDVILNAERGGQLSNVTGVAFTNNAGAAAGTLNNAPAAGNPTKWIPINDNGTIRNIPAW